MVEIVAVLVFDILVYIVQKCLVDDNHYRQMIGNLCNKAFAVYSYFNEKMGNFHYYPVEGVDFLGNLLNWSIYLEDSNNENISDIGFVCFFGGGGGGVGLFLTDLRNYNCVLQNCFF